MMLSGLERRALATIAGGALLVGLATLAVVPESAPPIDAVAISAAVDDGAISVQHSARTGRRSVARAVAARDVVRPDLTPAGRDETDMGIPRKLPFDFVPAMIDAQPNVAATSEAAAGSPKAAPIRPPERRSAFAVILDTSMEDRSASRVRTEPTPIAEPTAAEPTPPASSD